MWKIHFNKFFRSLILLFLALFLAIPLQSCSMTSANMVSKTSFVFSTVVTVTLYGTDSDELALGCFDILREIEKEISRTDPDSVLYHINKNGGGDMPEHMKAILADSLQYCDITRGCLDISIGDLTELWDFTSDEHTIPSSDEISLALEKSGLENITISGDKITIQNGCKMDLGAVAKGYAADRLREYLLENGVKNALIDLGGNILCVGEKPDVGNFKVGIKYPFKDGTIANLSLSDKSVVTSGVYERYFYEDNKLYHHILDPKTGYPCENGLLSVTIISDSSFVGDCLSTGCFVLGLDDGLELINSLPDVYGIFITDSYEVIMSDGLKDNIDISVTK